MLINTSYRKGRSLIQALSVGAFATLIGALAFAVNWNFFDTEVPAIHFLLFPGNQSLVYIWHPLFTEELGFWIKLMLLLLGQFVIVSAATFILLMLIKKLN